MIHVSLNAPLTRRKMVHLISDDEGENVAHHMKCSDVFDWLYQNGHDQATLHTGQGIYLVRLSLVEEVTPDEQEDR